MGNIEKEIHRALASPCEAVPASGDSGIFEGEAYKFSSRRCNGKKCIWLKFIGHDKKGICQMLSKYNECVLITVLSWCAIYEKYHIGKIATINLILERKTCGLTETGKA